MSSPKREVIHDDAEKLDYIADKQQTVGLTELESGDLQPSNEDTNLKPALNYDPVPW